MNRRGFTLVEVAAATVVLALLVIPLLGARNRTVAAAAGGARRLMVAQLAASKLSELATVPLEEIESSGEFDDAPGCGWSFAIDPYQPEGSEGTEAEEVVEEILDPYLYRVTLTITYPDHSKDDGNGSVKVTTLVLKQEPKEEEK